MKSSLFGWLMWSTAALGQSPLLSQTELYEDIVAKKINVGLSPYSPRYPLWSDTAQKNRWIWLPPATKIASVEDASSLTFTDFDHWTFPVGTKLWKEFSFANRRVETRLMEKTATKWEFSAYVWNEGETEATLAPTAGIKNHFAINAEVSHDIPSRNDCLMCHQRGGDPVLGFDAVQLSDETPGMLTFQELREKALLTHVPERFLHESPKVQATTELGRAAIGYLSANCGSCHNPDGRASMTELYFRHSTSATSPAEEVTYASAVNQISNGFLIPGINPTFRIVPGKPEESAVVYRMRELGAKRMPSLGTKLIDEPAVQLIADWVKEINP